MMTLLTLCVEFFMTGLFAIGGGLATLPFLSQMGMRHPEWFSQEMLANMVAISESTPGPIGVNMATYVGYSVCGIPGAIVTTFSLVLPSLLIILIIARMLKAYRENPLVNTSFAAIRPVVAGLIASSAFSLLKTVLKPSANTANWMNFPALNWVNAMLVVLFFVLTQIKPLKKIHPIVFILAGAVIGVVFKL